MSMLLWLLLGLLVETAPLSSAQDQHNNVRWVPVPVPCLLYPVPVKDIIM